MVVVQECNQTPARNPDDIIISTDGPENGCVRLTNGRTDKRQSVWLGDLRLECRRHAGTHCRSGGHRQRSYNTPPFHPRVETQTCHLCRESGAQMWLSDVKGNDGIRVSLICIIKYPDITEWILLKSSQQHHDNIVTKISNKISGRAVMVHFEG